MRDLFITHSKSHDDAVRAHVLLKMSLIKLRIQSEVLSLSQRSRKPAFRSKLSSEEWNKRRRLAFIRVNQILDFQDASSTWRRGVVGELFP